MIKFFHDRHLIWRIGLLFFCCISLATAINAVLVYQNSMDLYLEDQFTQSQNLAKYTKNEMNSSANMTWLLPYWRTHYKTMDIVYDDEATTQAKYTQFMKRNPDLNFQNASTEELNQLPDKDQGLYAEVAYMQLTDLFDRLKRVYHPSYLCCFYRNTETSLFYYVTGTEEGEKRGNASSLIYCLGSTSDIEKGIYPVLEKTWDTGEIQDAMDQPIKEGEGSGLYHIFVPIVQEGKTVCMIGVTLESYTIRSELRSKMIRVEIFSVLVFLISGILLLLLVRGVVIQPIAVLQRSIRRFTENKDSHRIVDSLKRYQSQNEIGQLATDVSGLAVEIARYTDEIRHMASEQERIHTELALATKIQEEMLPREFPRREEFSLYATMKPAKEVGGDFYDFFFIDENHLAIVIGDVSGKGVPAALFMVKSKSLIKEHAMAGLSPEEVFVKTNNELCEGNDAQLFTTAWMGILEISTGRLLFTEAGHENPVRVKVDGSAEYVMPAKKKLVLGSFEDIPYILNETILEMGETLLLYTDGLPEGENESHEFYGLDRMMKSVEVNAKATGQDFIHAIVDGLSDYVGEAEQFDDLTLLCVTRTK